MKLETDGIQYDIITRAVHAVQDIPGLFCEIGTRRGGSLQIAIDAALETGQHRHYISVDPYGNIPYNDGKAITTYDYTNNMKAEAMAQIWAYVAEKGVNFVHWCLTDKMFFEKFGSGVPVYDQNVVFHGSYAFAFLDGPHDAVSIVEELSFFSPRMLPGAQVVIDNIESFDVKAVLNAANRLGFDEVERNIQKIRLCRH